MLELGCYYSVNDEDKSDVQRSGDKNGNGDGGHGDDSEYLFGSAELQGKDQQEE